MKRQGNHESADEEECNDYHQIDSIQTAQRGNGRVKDKTLEASHHRLRVRRLSGEGMNLIEHRGIFPILFP